MIRKILVPLDRSPLAERALLQAVEIAKRADARLRLVHVWVALPPRGEFLGEPLRQLEARAREDALRYLDATAAQVSGGSGLQVETVPLRAPVAEAICEDAHASRSDLIVMSTHGRTGWSRVWLGSVADQVMRHATVPVLLVRSPDEGVVGPPQRLARVLVPLDGSPAGEEILAPLVDLLGLFEPSCELLRVVTLVRTPQYISTVGLPVMIPDELATAQAVRDAEQYLAGVVERLHDTLPTLRVVARVEVDESPGARIVASTRGMDLVAVATRGRGPSRLILGSVADKVLRGSTASVLLVRRTPMHAESPGHVPVEAYAVAGAS